MQARCRAHCQMDRQNCREMRGFHFFTCIYRYYRQQIYALMSSMSPGCYSCKALLLMQTVDLRLLPSRTPAASSRLPCFRLYFKAEVKVRGSCSRKEPQSVLESRGKIAIHEKVCSALFLIFSSFTQWFGHRRLKSALHGQ